MSSPATFASTTKNTSPYLHTALAILEGYNTWTIPAVLAHRTATCVHEIAPASLSRPPLTNLQYATFFAQIMPLFQDFTLKVKEAVVDEAGGKVTVWAESTAVTRIGPYANEYMLLFWMVEGGEKMERVVEFVDSGYTKGFMERLREAAASDAEGGVA